MNTANIMKLALDLAKLDEVPADSGIFVEKENIQKILVGIDLEGPEILLAKELGVDCVVSHHPYAGTAVTEFYKVMDGQIDRMMSFGVPINKAQKALKKKKFQVDLNSHVKNFDRASSIAKLLGMGYMNIHMPADILTENFVQNYLDQRFANEAKTTLKEVIEALNDLSEYKNSKVKPVIRVGSDGDYAGKIAVLMAGGTNGGADVYKAYFDAGVGTIVCMHVPEDVKKAVEEQNIGNIIVAGHMPSDSIGINQLIKVWRQAGVIVETCSGVVE